MLRREGEEVHGRIHAGGDAWRNRVCFSENAPCCGSFASDGKRTWSDGLVRCRQPSIDTTSTTRCAVMLIHRLRFHRYSRENARPPTATTITWLQPQVPTWAKVKAAHDTHNATDRLPVSSCRRSMA